MTSFPIRNTLIALVTVALLYFGYQYIFTQNVDDNGQYNTEAVERTDISSSISATGALVATSTVEVGTQVSGTLLTVDADYNENVIAGQIIARIDPSTYEARVEQAKASLASAQASLLEANANALNAELDYIRKKTLAEKQLVSITDRDLAKSLLDQTRSRVLSAKAQIQLQQANLNSAQLDLAKTIIRSPVKGTVLARNVEPGQTVAASLQTPVLFTIAGDLSEMEIVLAIDEADIGQVREGQKATFTVDAFSDKNYSGTVKQIRLDATNVSNVVTYPVVLAVKNSDQELLPGMTATAQIITSQKMQVLTLPSAALRFRPASATDSGPTIGTASTSSATSPEERTKRTKIQLDAMRELLTKINASEAVKSVFEQSSTDYLEKMQQQVQSSIQGAGQQTSERSSQQNGNQSGSGNSGGSRNKRLAERFAKSFEPVRTQLNEQQRQQWDQQIQSLFNAKRATVYVLENGVPTAVEIRLGASDGSRVEVIGGLALGQKVIVGSVRVNP